ncbi:MAG: hypothetical protein WC756_16805 [Taibaiella sp.]|jgi:hypothetical protein
MKTGIIILLLSFIANTVPAQKYITVNGKPAIVIVTSVEGHHTVRSSMDTAWVNMKTRTLYCRVALKDLNFGLLPMFASKRTVVDRFLTSYMEIDRYPFITYEASFPSVQKKALSNGDTIMTKGILTAHGVSKEVQIPVVLTKSDKELILVSLFKVKPVDDYKVRATSGIRYRFLNNIKVQVNAVLTEY